MTVVRTTSLTPAAFAENDFVEAAYRVGQAVFATRTENSRKEQGQFLTSPGIARYMAKQLGALPEDARLLDPSIGSAVLPCAVIERAIATGFPKRLQVIGYETDSELCEVASAVLADAESAALRHGIAVSFEIRHRDFLSAHFPLAVSPLFGSTEESWTRFHAVVANPPYFKLRADDPRLRAMTGRVRGQTNIYTLFMALSAKLLEEQGRSVFIVPRSFCSGAYFAGFRADFVEMVKTTHIHVFESRQEVFKSDAVLQENIIISFEKPTKGQVWRDVQITS